MIKNIPKVSLNYLDFQLVAESLFDILKKGKAQERKCDFIVGWYEERPSDLSLAKNTNNKHIYINRQALFDYHPFSMRLRKQYPSLYQDILQDDIDKLYEYLICQAAREGYNLIIDDSFSNPQKVVDMITLLRSLGYHTNVSVLKCQIIQREFTYIKNYIIDLVTSSVQSPLTQVTFPASKWKELVESKAVHALYIFEPLFASIIYLDGKNKLNYCFNVRKSQNIDRDNLTYTEYIALAERNRETEEAFLLAFSDVSFFLKSYREYLNPLDYAQVASWLDNLKNSYYDSIDMELLEKQRGR